MNDRELLELAAKAAGIGPVIGFDIEAGELMIGPRSDIRYWNPLADDGAALRLAVKLCITVEQSLLESAASAYVLVGKCRNHFNSVSGSVSRSEATRRAIVRAAAEIGRAMP